MTRTFWIRQFWIGLIAWPRIGVELDPNLPEAHFRLGFVLAFKQHDASIAEFEIAIELNPNYSLWFFAVPLVLSGQPERAVQYARWRTLRKDPEQGGRKALQP